MFVESANIRTAVAAAADLYNGDPTSDYFDMSEAEEITFVVFHGAGATGTAAFTVAGASDNTGTGAEAIPFKYRVNAIGAAAGALTDATASGYTIVAGANQILLVTVKADAMPDGKPFVALTATEGVDSPVAGCIGAIMTGLRYTDGTPAAALA